MIGDKDTTLKNIERSSLPRVLGWYNSGGEYRYAAGFDGSGTLRDLEERFDSINGSDDEFFLGIYQSSSGELAGTIIGSVRQGALWIKLLAVAPELRRRGVGSSSAGMLLKYFREMNYASECFLSVVEENETGKLFWLKNGFQEVNMLPKHRLFDGLEHNVIIMQKSL